MTVMGIFAVIGAFGLVLMKNKQINNSTNDTSIE